MRIIGAIAIVAAMGGAAVAGPKPTAKEARTTVEAWLAALEDSTGEDAPKPALIALTALPFRYETTSDAADLADESGVFCKNSTITDAANLGPPLDCLREYGSLGYGDFKPWSKKIARHSFIARSHKKDLRAIDKTATLVTRDQDCAGQGQETLFAVTKDPDGTMKVAAVFTFSYFCGE